MKNIFLLLSSMVLISSANADSNKYWNGFQVDPGKTVTVSIPENFHEKEMFLICEAYVPLAHTYPVVVKVDGKVLIIRGSDFGGVERSIYLTLPHTHVESEEKVLKITVENLDDARILNFQKCKSSYYRGI